MGNALQDNIYYFIKFYFSYGNSFSFRSQVRYQVKNFSKTLWIPIETILKDNFYFLEFYKPKKRDEKNNN